MRELIVTNTKRPRDAWLTDSRDLQPTTKDHHGD
jgi:hypothetical protein